SSMRSRRIRAGTWKSATRTSGSIGLRRAGRTPGRQLAEFSGAAHHVLLGQLADQAGLPVPVGRENRLVLGQRPRRAGGAGRVVVHVALGRAAQLLEHLDGPREARRLVQDMWNSRSSATKPSLSADP